MMKHYDLSRFKTAQQRDYGRALNEIRAGRKRSHWMWYIFPQIKGLGFSPTSEYYCIEGLAEAAAFLDDEYLGHNLREISAELLKLKSNDPTEVFGMPDDMKLRSCMTLFAHAGADNEVFLKVLDKFFDGKEDSRTLRKLGIVR